MEEKKFNDISGIILVNKPEKWTSHDCVSLIRRKIGVKRVGHTGTLDPMATGVLPVCIGSATRIMDYTYWDIKEYTCKIKLGISTDTEDIWGEILKESPLPKLPKKYLQKEIEQVISKFIGEIEQVPPKYSALKVNGKKLYQYARAGEAVEIKPRKITVHEIQLTDIKTIYIDGIENNSNSENSQMVAIDEIGLKVKCSKGTYIRTLCKDISEALGACGTMSHLVRNTTGFFDLSGCITCEDIKNISREDLLKKIIKTDEALMGFGSIRLDFQLSKDFVNGKKTNLKKQMESFSKNIEIEKTNSCSFPENLYRVYFNESFIGVGKLEENILIPDKVFDVSIQKISESSQI